MPLIIETAIRDTISGSDPNERRLMIGFSGLSLTSATGLKLTFKPMARSSRPVTAPAS